MNQFCDKCGSQINQTTGTCPNCSPNYVVNNQPQMNKPENKKHTTKEVVAVVVAIALFSGLFGILGYVFGKVQNSLPKSYNEIVERYKLAIAGEKDDEKTLSNKLIDRVNEFDNYEICYSYIDINNDKTKELIIGGHVADEDVETYDIYTMDSNKNAVQLLPVNNYDEVVEIEIYNEVIKVSEEKEETSHFEYLKLPENQWEVEKDEEYLYEDEKYFEIIEEEKNEISEETFKEADTKYEGEELDLEWVKVVLEEDNKEKETTQDNSNPEWVSELTKGYWEYGCSVLFLYKFNVDGTGKSYCVPHLDVIDANTLDTVESKFIDSFNWKADGEYLHIINKEGGIQKVKWVSYSDNYDWGEGIVYPKDEKFFYDVEYVEDEYGMTVAFHLFRHHEEKTETTTETTTEKPKLSDAEIYQEYLKNGGLKKEIGEYWNTQYTKIESCLIDLNNDGTSELLLNVTDTESYNIRGHECYSILYGICNENVVTLKEAYFGGGSGGGDYLYIKYDTKKQKYVVVKDGYSRDGYYAYEAYLEAYSYNGSTLTKYLDLESPGFDSTNEFYADTVEEYNAQTSFYTVEDDYYTYYKIDGQFVTESDYNKAEARFKDPTDSRYKMKTGTWSNPLAL